MCYLLDQKELKKSFEYTSEADLTKPKAEAISE